MTASGEVVDQGLVEPSGNGRVSLLDWLNRIANITPSAVAVAVEAPHGSIVDALVESGFAVFSLNPK